MTRLHRLSVCLSLAVAIGTPVAGSGTGHAADPISGKPAGPYLAENQGRRDPRSDPSGGIASVNDCDRLAAHPDDPQRKAPGLYPWRMDNKAALAACKSAVGQYPDEPRFNLQYGRALYATRNYAECFKRYRAAATRGHPLAMVFVGNLYIGGVGVARDAAAGKKWLRKAHALKFKMAELALAVLRLRGLAGVKQDPDKAIKVIRRWSMQGHPTAQVNLALAYRAGWGVTRNLAAAFAWYRKAAEQGMPFAQTQVGLAYEQARGAPRSYKRALKWYRRAAKRKHYRAEYRIGGLYYLGKGVPKDYAEAFDWWHKSARGGDAMAQFSLGKLYELGHGPTANRLEAYFWFSLAAKNEVRGAERNAQRLAGRLTAAQRAEVAQRVAAWKPDR